MSSCTNDENFVSIWQVVAEKNTKVLCGQTDNQTDPNAIPSPNPSARVTMQVISNCLYSSWLTEQKLYFSQLCVFSHLAFRKITFHRTSHTLIETSEKALWDVLPWCAMSSMFCSTSKSHSNFAEWKIWCKYGLLHSHNIIFNILDVVLWPRLFSADKAVTGGKCMNWKFCWCSRVWKYA